MPLIDTPKAADILCGKDKTFGKHPGNMLYRDLIEAKAIDYANAVYKLDKMKLTTEIVATMVTEFGSRFLRPVGVTIHKDNTISATEGGSGGTHTVTATTTSDGNITTQMIGWEEISLTAARDKTSHALRFCAANTVPNRNSNNTGAALETTTTTTTGPTSTDTTATTAAPNSPTATTASVPKTEAQSQPQQTDFVSVTAKAVAYPQPGFTTTDAVTTTANNSTSLIQSQLNSSMIALTVPNNYSVDTSQSNSELEQQQNQALQKNIEKLMQHKMNQQKDSQLQQLQALQQLQQQPPLPSSQSLSENMDVTMMTTTTGHDIHNNNGVVKATGSKFKKLPTKSSLLQKTKIKIPPAELLNSTTTPVKFNRVKVQRSSRKPKLNPTPSSNSTSNKNTATATMMKMMQNRQQQQLLYNNYNMVPPSHLLPQQQQQQLHNFGVGPYSNTNPNSPHRQPGTLVVVAPPIPSAKPVVGVTTTTLSNNNSNNKTDAIAVSTSTVAAPPGPTGNTTRTVSADMIVLATAAAAVEAAEAHAVAVAAREAAAVAADKKGE